MRFKSTMLALALLPWAPGAFAAEAVAVNIPFAFETGGERFPASQYAVALSDDCKHMTLTSKELPAKALFLLVEPADVASGAPELSIKFENASGVHALRSIRLGSYQAMQGLAAGK
jgi:hypothetical protein